MGFYIKCTDSLEKHFDPKGSFAPVATCDFAFVIEMTFRWRADNDPLVVVFWILSSSKVKTKKKKKKKKRLSKLNPLWQNFLDPRMP